MPIFRLEDSELIIAQETDLELESHLEDWLENSPPALAQEPILWIGRQTSAAVEESTIFPDLLGLDSNGDLVIVELKRDEAPPKVVAQLLEYAAWANELSEQQIQDIAEKYFATRDEFKETHFHDAIRDVFDIPDTDEIPPLNRNMRLYILAGSIPARIAHVCRFLRTSHGMDINCIDVSTFETEAGEKLISMEAKVGDEDVVSSKTQKHRVSQSSRRSGDKGVREVVRDAVRELTKDNTDVEFTIKEVTLKIHKTDPNFNKRTVNGQIAQDCVNNPGRHRNYPYAKHDYYWKVSQGKYRLYDPEKDAVEEAAVSDED